MAPPLVESRRRHLRAGDDEPSAESRGGGRREAGAEGEGEEDEVCACACVYAAVVDSAFAVTWFVGAAIIATRFKGDRRRGVCVFSSPARSS